jgi:uncharacterized membrane protein YheB (UPF0754 family)
MQSNPKETSQMLQRDEPEILEMINEFCNVMGEHFCSLGEEQEKVTSAAKSKSAIIADDKVREIGVLEKEAMKKHKNQSNQQSNQTSSQGNTTVQSSATSQDADADEQVASILSNDELRSILLDTKMQQIMQECSTQGGKLQYYMRHEEYGPKLRKLMEAGLLRVA